MGSEPGQAGYGKPPLSSQFKKGRSGNPRGRPRGRRKLGAPYEAVLGQRVTVRSDGKERTFTAAEAFLLHMTQKGLAGDASAARSMLEAIEATAGVSTETPNLNIATILLHARNTERGPRVLEIICRLGMAAKLDAYRESARVVLQVWVVELALARLGDRRLSVTEQATIWGSCRTPWKVRWPEWWEYKELSIGPLKTKRASC